MLSIFDWLAAGGNFIFCVTRATVSQFNIQLERTLARGLLRLSLFRSRFLFDGYARSVGTGGIGFDFDAPRTAAGLCCGNGSGSSLCGRRNGSRGGCGWGRLLAAGERKAQSGEGENCEDLAGGWLHLCGSLSRCNCNKQVCGRSEFARPANRASGWLIRESGFLVRRNQACHQRAQLRRDERFSQKMPSLIQYQHPVGEPGHQQYFDISPFLRHHGG
jgi:hypothetical protein